MRLMRSRAGGALRLAAFALLAAGCGQGDNTGGPVKGAGGKEKPAAVARAKGDAKKGGHEESKHEGWWCDEHGVPEAECSLCSARAAAEFKKKGDWCEEHDRAKSQCFACDPKAKARYAALYRAKEGKDPPPTEDGPAGKAEKK
jgi:hypothetical protein